MENCCKCCGMMEAGEALLVTGVPEAEEDNAATRVSNLVCC
jgi:hypothetical protein